MKRKPAAILLIVVLTGIGLNDLYAREDVYMHDTDTALEIAGFSQHGQTYAVRYIQWYKQRGAEPCNYPKIYKQKVAAVTLQLYKRERKVNEWHIYKEFDGEIESCSSHKEAKAELKQAKAAFKEHGVDLAIKGTALVLRPIQRKGDLPSANFSIPIDVMKQSGVNAEVVVERKAFKVGEEYWLARSASAENYGMVRLHTWFLSGFTSYTISNYAWLNPNETGVIYFEHAVDDSGSIYGPYFIEIAKLAARFLNLKGFDLCKQKKYSAAKEAFELALRHNKTYALALYNLARVQVLLGENEAALFSLERVLALDYNNFLQIIQRDEDLKTLHALPRFTKLFQK